MNMKSKLKSDHPLDAATCSFSFLSVCSGIEAASVAWEPLGWKAQAFAEIEKFPSAVLAHHWPDVPNLGDMTKHYDWPNSLRPDLIVGGTPCQAFSVAGLRQGLGDPRGNLTLVFLGILAQFRPRWVVWENVPGVLSDKTGAFGAFLGGLGELGYGFAYRVLDAQHFGVPQRRRRVFVVAHLGDWRRAAAVLFEPESLRGDHPPRRQAGQGVARGFECGPQGGRFTDTATRCKDGPIRNQLGAGVISSSVTGYVNAGHFGSMREAHVSDPIRAKGGGTGNGGETLLAFSCKDHGADASAIAPTLRSMGHDGSHANGGGQVAIAIQAGAIKENPNHGPDGIGVRTNDQAYTLEARAEVQAVAVASAVRRLTPMECERLQGFPDNHTLIPWRGKMAPDGPRYKALGNSMAVPVMRWIGERISQMNVKVSLRAKIRKHLNRNSNVKDR